MARRSHYDARRAISQFERSLGLPTSDTVPEALPPVAHSAMNPFESVESLRRSRKRWNLMSQTADLEHGHLPAKGKSV